MSYLITLVVSGSVTLQHGLTRMTRTTADHDLLEAVGSTPRGLPIGLLSSRYHSTEDFK